MSEKYSLTKFYNPPDNRNTAIRFGMTISPLNLCDTPHQSEIHGCADDRHKSAYRSINGLFARKPNKNSAHLVP